MKRSTEALEFGATPVISITRRSADLTAILLQTGRTDPLNCCAEYKGYRLNACARPTSSELSAADLVIGRPGFPSRHFRGLDYFYDARQALRYATRWGRIWVDHQLAKSSGNVSPSAERARHGSLDASLDNTGIFSLCRRYQDTGVTEHCALWFGIQPSQRQRSFTGWECQNRHGMRASGKSPSVSLP